MSEFDQEREDLAEELFMFISRSPEYRLGGQGETSENAHEFIVVCPTTGHKFKVLISDFEE